MRRRSATCLERRRRGRRPRRTRASAASAPPRSAPCRSAAPLPSAPSATASLEARGRTRSRARRRRPGRPAGRAGTPARRPDHLPRRASRRPRSARPFSLPWQVNGSAPSASASWRRVDASGRRRRPAARADRDRARRAASSRCEHDRVGVRRDEDARAAGPPARATTAAASAALPQLAIARSRRAAGSASPSRSATSSQSRTPEQVARLVRAGDVAGLVLDPDAAAPREAEPVAQRRARGANGVAAKPWPSTAATRVVELVRRARTKSSSLMPPRERQVVGVEQRRGSGRTGSARRRPGKPHRASGRARGARTWSTSSPRPRSGSGTGTGSPAPARAPQPAQTSGWQARGRSQRLQHARAGVELVDHARPTPAALAQLAPEGRVAPGLEVLDRDALLLDPGEVAEVEDPLALLARQLAAGGRSSAPSRCSPKTSAAADLVEAVGEVLRAAPARARCRTSRRRRWRP